MNHDVDDHSSAWYPSLQSTDNNHNEIHGELKDENTNIISRIRSLFSQTAECNDFDHPESRRFPSLSAQLPDQSLLDICNQSYQTEPSPLNSSFLDMSNSTSSKRFSDVKRIISNFKIPNRQPSCQRPHHSRFESAEFSCLETGHTAISPTHSTCSALNYNTPPLTPDSFDGTVNSACFEGSSDLYSRIDSHQQYIDSNQRGIHIHNEDNNSHHIRQLSRSQEIKEGKKPERPICYDTLIADISGENPPMQAEGPNHDIRDEWYGLELALELSRRERSGSMSGSHTSAGEHSKSHESWAVIHQGTVPPVQEDEDFCHWQRWHRYLDDEDEMRKIEKVSTFAAMAEEFAYCYVEEVKTRDWIRWEEEHRHDANTQNIGRAQDHLYILTKNRPDPYAPAMKHNLGWQLKRSRTLGCIRDLLRNNLDDDSILELKLDDIEDEDSGFDCYDPTW